MDTRPSTSTRSRASSFADGYAQRLRYGRRVAAQVVLVLMVLGGLTWGVWNAIELRDGWTWGTFTATGQSCGYRNSCHSTGAWVSDDGSHRHLTGYDGTIALHSQVRAALPRIVADSSQLTVSYGAGSTSDVALAPWLGWGIAAAGAVGLLLMAWWRRNQQRLVDRVEATAFGWGLLPR